MANNPDDVKQVIVIRKDLNMRKGKIAAQAAHASMAVFFNRSSLMTDHGEDYLDIPLTEDMSIWVSGLFTKICVSVNSEEELLRIHEEAEYADIPCSLIKDAGLTEFGGVPTYTAVAIGPAKSKDIDKITGNLKLL